MTCKSHIWTKSYFTNICVLLYVIIYLEHGCLIDRQSQLWIQKAINQAFLWSISNRSGLWCHIIGACRRQWWLCRKHSNNVARHDETPVKSTLLSRDKNILFHVAWEWHYVVTFIHLEVARHALSVWLLLQCCDIRRIFFVVRYIIKHLFYESVWYYFETMQMTSQALSKFTENTRLRFVFSIQNLTRLVTSFLWFQNGID